MSSDSGIRLLAGASGVGFILAICGSNAMTPLLPGYMDRHGFGPAAAVLFAMYFVAIIVILIISARGPLIRHSRKVLPIAFLTAIAGDLVEIAGAWIPLVLFPGRLMTGASVALSTGAAAAMMVAAKGEQGRAFIARGSLIGAGAGLMAAILIAVYLPWRLVTVYAIHAIVMAICLGVLFAGLRAAPNLLAPGSDPMPVGDEEPAEVPSDRTCDIEIAADRSRSRDPGAFLIGALAWAIGALAVGAMPNAILATGASDSLLVAQCVGGACLLVSMIANLAGVGLRALTASSLRRPASDGGMVGGDRGARDRPPRDHRVGHGHRRDRPGRWVPRCARRTSRWGSRRSSRDGWRRGSRRSPTPGPG